MLRSNRRLQADGCLVAFTLVFAAAFAGAQPAGDVTSAPEVPWKAILLSGPDLRVGIDLLAPDLTTHWYGRYELATARLEVFFVRAPLRRPATWSVVPCRERALRGDGESLFYHERAANWALLVHLERGELPPGVTICGFVDGFVTQHLRFETLQQVTIPGAAPVFPAVIEL